VYKYREGKVESTLERELNVPEIVADQAIGTSLQLEMCSRGWLVLAFRTSGVGSHPVSGSTGLRSSADTCRDSEYATVNLVLRNPARGVPSLRHSEKGLEDIILCSVSGVLRVDLIV
jgi:hypothetical protein